MSASTRYPRCSVKEAWWLNTNGKFMEQKPFSLLPLQAFNPRHLSGHSHSSQEDAVPTELFAPRSTRPPDNGTPQHRATEPRRAIWLMASHPSAGGRVHHYRHPPQKSGALQNQRIHRLLYHRSYYSPEFNQPHHTLSLLVRSCSTAHHHDWRARMVPRCCAAGASPSHAAPPRRLLLCLHAAQCPPPHCPGAHHTKTGCARGRLLWNRGGGHPSRRRNQQMLQPHPQRRPGPRNVSSTHAPPNSHAAMQTRV